MNKERAQPVSTAELPNRAVSSNLGRGEWPAVPRETIEVKDAEGKIVVMNYVDWLAKIGNNNRGGT